MRDRGLLRWGEVLGEVREMTARGAFGKELRFSRVAGDWVFETVPDEVDDGVPVLIGNALYLPSSTTFLSVPVTVGGVPVNADPRPSFELSEAQMQGWTVAYLSEVFDVGLGNFPTPAVLRVGDVASLPTLTSERFVLPLGLVRSGRLLPIRYSGGET